MFRKVAALSLALLAAAPALAHEYGSKGITVAHPWARATPAGATTGAAFLEIKAGKGVTDKLVGASTKVAGVAEIHNHVMEGGMAKMRKVDAVAIPAGKSLVLGPGGYHIMLMALKQPLKEGDLLKLTLQFEKAGKIEVEASVEAVGAKGPHGFDHQPGHEPAKGDAAGAHKH